MKAQEFSSAGTSINSKKVPAIFKKIRWQAGTRNLDWGGGKYDTATVYLAGVQVKNRIYDPYNRTEKENAEALAGAGSEGYDTVTISNVLNVIKEPEIRLATVTQAMQYLKSGGKLYITVYEGDKTGAGKQSKTGCWQENRRLEDYRKELEKFGAVKKNGTLEIIKK